MNSTYLITYTVIDTQPGRSRAAVKQAAEQVGTADLLLGLGLNVSAMDLAEVVL